MSATPQVSVLLTAYNRERYLASSIESVLAQTFRDFELLIVDDCSTDKTLAVAREYERRDPRVRLVANERNLGDYGNRRKIATLARAPLLKYHDSDDLMYPHCLQTMVPMLLSEPRAAFGLSSGVAWPGGPCPMLLTPRMAYQREYFGEGLFSCGPSGAIFRADAFRELGGFVEEGGASDYYFWMRACTRVNVLLLPADLFWYRLHPAQELQSAKGRADALRTAGAAWRALDAPECPLTPAEREQAKRNRAYHLARRTCEDLTHGRWTNASRRLRASSMGARDWIAYLRRPRRDALAGTPLDAQGEFVVPPWATETPR